MWFKSYEHMHSSIFPNGHTHLVIIVQTQHRAKNENLYQTVKNELFRVKKIVFAAREKILRVL